MVGGIDQVDHGGIAAIKPGTAEGKVRTRPFGQADNAGVEGQGRRQPGAPYIHMLKPGNPHFTLISCVRRG